MQPFPKLKFWQSARTRLLILVLLVVFPAFLVLAVGAYIDLQQSVNDRKQESVQVIRHAQSDFEEVLSETRRVFSELVRLNEMRNPNNCTQVFTGLRFAYERLAPNITNLGLATRQGEIYCAINPLQGSANIAGQVEFQTAVKNLDLSVGNYRISAPSSKPVISVAYPVLSFDGKVQTIIFATFDISWIKTWQSEVTLPPGSVLSILSADNTLLWRTLDNELVLPDNTKVEKMDWLARLAAGESAVEAPDFDGVTRLHSLIPLGNAGQLILGYPVRELYAKAYQSLTWKLALLSLVVIAAMGIAWWGSESMLLHPLRSLLAVVQRVQDGDLSARVSSLNGLGELKFLARSFDQMTDALQRREAERRQMQERFRAAFESSAIGMGLLTIDGWILAANAAVCAMSGYSEEELKQRNDRQNSHPDDVDAGMDLFAEMLAGKRGYYSIEKRYLRKNGEIFWTRLTLSLVRDDRGEPAYLIGMVEDIDEIKRKNAALAVSEARFRTIFDATGLGVGIMGLDRRVIEVNPALCKMFGYPREELIGQTNLLVVHPDDYEQALRQTKELVSGACDSFEDERRYIRKNGEVFWASIMMSMVRDENRVPLYIVGIVTDIDARKKAQESLRETEARFIAMYDNTAIGMAMMSLDRKIISMNQASARMTGYSIEELVGTDPSRLSHPDDLMVGMEQFQDLIKGKISGFQMEKRFIRKDARIFWGRVTYSTVRKEDGRPEYLVGIIEDVTEQKVSAERLAAQEAEYRRTLEERILERTEELNLANIRLREKAAQDAVLAERTRLARDLHDAVTQTLFSTTLIADVLPEIWENNQAEGRRRLEELRVMTRGALAEMRTLLVELRPNALIEVPLPTLLRQLADALAGRARITILLSAEGERKLPPDVQVSMYRIAQEALNNVVKHSKASEAVMTLRLGDTVRLTIADNGKGFDPSIVTADHLGLKIMRERAESIGARLSVYSEPEEGTQISVVWQDPMEHE